MKKLLHPTVIKHKGHIIAWTLFIFYEIVIVAVFSGSFNSTWDYLGHYALHISLFYFHARVVLPWVLRRKRMTAWLLPLLLIGEVTVYINLTYLLEVILTEYLQVKLMRPLVFDYYYWLRALWRAIYFLGFSTGYFFLRNYIREQKRANRAESEQLLKIIEQQNLQHELIKSQNAYLKTQINPHFLFNTLSFVYNSVRKTSAEAAEAIMALSQMMRYALQNEDDQHETLILEEIEHVESLIRIHQIRHKDTLNVQLIYSDNLAGVKFVPLILMTLVENIFKHGDLTQQQHPAQIKIMLDANTLRISTSNLKSSLKPESHRIGLDNIHKRLDQVYKEKASFSTYSTIDGLFVTVLKVSDLSPLLLRQNQLNTNQPND
ncbi:sensor histidine kinase [Pontibacter litorisediminis]|uniref:sensor histidine kinase n=1 Tax=Pontibacter litorisediminis TaxID=1846260 RepID=UPI0023ECF338|nr:histidine kinase [Pontibacter litorisediminis]